MAQPIEFYFDFSSPYGYLAAQQIDTVGEKHGRAVAWKPFLLGTVFSTTGSQPLLNIPMKGDYARIDMAREARRLGVPFTIPTPFPFHSLAACRAFYWLEDQDPAAAKALAKAVFHGAFGEGRDMGDGEAVIELAGELGVDREALAVALKDPAVKERLRKEVENGTEKGVFGAPFLFVDGEPFWGQDRIETIDRWLETGGW
ncbi:MAG: 2-hydroxychromene-2-carboxylate isomerase [Pseudomonadota bacterium]